MNSLNHYSPYILSTNSLRLRRFILEVALVWFIISLASVCVGSENTGRLTIVHLMVRTFFILLGGVVCGGTRGFLVNGLRGEWLEPETRPKVKDTSVYLETTGRRSNSLSPYVGRQHVIASPQHGLHAAASQPHHAEVWGRTAFITSPPSQGRRRS